MTKSILELSHTEARLFFLEQRNFCSIELPEYFEFQSLLDVLSTEIQNKSFNQIQCNNHKPKEYDDVNHIIFNNKDGKFAWRPLQLINPVLYVFLVHKITEENNWKLIVNRFKFFQNNKIKCCSIPILSEETKRSDKAYTVERWWEETEQQSLKLSLNFEYLLNTDITDCYGSIYTHTISWALHKKDIIKSNFYLPKKERKEYLGDEIDEIIRAMQNGQTNGIPQGSILMDFIAEMILGYTDSLLYDKIKTEKIKNYKILRYRDDYRIFTNSQEDAVKIARYLTEILIGLNLKLNSNKTFISNNIIQDAIKPDKIFWLANKQKEKTLQKTLLLIHLLAKKYPNSGSVTKALSYIQRKIHKKQKLGKENIEVLISIVVDIAHKNPKTYPMAIAILSKLLSLLKNKRKVNDVIASIEKKFNKNPNVGLLQIWLQRLTLKGDKNKDYKEKLCKKVVNNSTKIWNTDWLDKSIKNIFAQNSIINRNYIQNMESIIKPEEIQLFEY